VNIAKMMQQAKKMQQGMEKMKEEAWRRVEVVGESGGGDGQGDDHGRPLGESGQYR